MSLQIIGMIQAHRVSETQARSGKLPEAIATLEPLAAGPDGQADVQTTLADLYEQAGRWKEAAGVWGALGAKSPEATNLSHTRRTLARL